VAWLGADDSVFSIAWPRSANLRDDVLAFLRRAAALLDGVFGEAVRGLMAETLIDPDRTATARAGAFMARDRVMREILDRAAARGETRSAALTPQLVGLAPALADHHFLVYGTPIPDDVLTGIVDNVLLPLLTHAGEPGGA
jgi:hypothetical protein